MHGAETPDQARAIQIQTSSTGGGVSLRPIKNKGLVRFLMRGQEKCSAEWDLHCIGHNLNKLQQAWG
jgi:Transposase DDE domain